MVCGEAGVPPRSAEPLNAEPETRCDDEIRKNVKLTPVSSRSVSSMVQTVSNRTVAQGLAVTVRYLNGGAIRSCKELRKSAA